MSRYDIIYTDRDGTVESLELLDETGVDLETLHGALGKAEELMKNLGIVSVSITDNTREKDE